MVPARHAAQMGREGGKEVGLRGLWGSRGNVEHSWAGRGRAAPSAWGCTHLPRLGEVWAPDVPAGREGWGGESCQHEQSPSQAPGLLWNAALHAQAVWLAGRPPEAPLGLWSSPQCPQLSAVCSAPWCGDVGSSPRPTLAGIPAAWEGLSPAALAGTQRGNCCWQRAQRALRSWHGHRRNSVTAGRQAPQFAERAPTHCACRVFQAGRLAPGAAGEPEKPLCATRKGLFSKQDR